MNSEDLAEIQSRFKKLRNEAAGIVDVETRIQRVRDLGEEELFLVNTRSVWDRITKLCDAKLIERAYVSKGDFGSSNRIMQYMVTDTEVSFFDASGFVVFTRHSFDLPEAELDKFFESNTNQSARTAGKHD